MKHLYHWVSAVAWEKRAEEMAGVGVTTVACSPTMATFTPRCYWAQLITLSCCSDWN